MEKKRASAKYLLEIATSPKAHVAGAVMRRSLRKALSDPLYKNDPLRGLFTERENIKTEIELFERLTAQANLIDKDADTGKRKRETDKTRTTNSTKTKRGNRQPVIAAIQDEAQDIIKKNRYYIGKPYAIEGNITKRIEAKVIKKKNVILLQDKPSPSTIVRHVKSFLKSLNQ